MLACTALRPWLHTFEELDLVVRGQGDHRLSPGGRMLDAVPLYPFGLTFDVDDVHLSHVHAERLLHSLLDLVLVAGAANPKNVLVIAAEARSLLRDERSQEDVQRVDGLRHRLRLLLPGPWPPGGGLGLLRRRFGGRPLFPGPRPPGPADPPFA